MSNIGKVSLDVELQSDLNKQINEIADTISRQLEQTLNKGLKNALHVGGESVKNQMKSLTDSVKKQTKSMNDSIKNQTKSVSDSVKNSTKSATDSIKKQTQSVTNSIANEVKKIQNMFRRLGKLAIASLVIGKVGQYIKNSVQSAMQVEASLQQVARTMGESTQSFLKWAETSALSFNMAQSDALKFGATYSNLVSSFLSDTNQITGATTELLKASSVIASATGRTMEDVMERIRSGLLGNTEAIEDLGVNVNVALLETTEAFKRLANGKSWNQLSFQTQQQIRLMAILEQTSSKFGNEVFQNTNSSLQQLVAILKDVALNLGNAFLPIANVVIPLLSKMAMWLRTVTSYFAAFMQTLFGYSPKANAGIGGTVNSTIGQVGSLGDSLDSAGTSADKTKKKLQNLLGGFDELNTINFDSSSDSGSAGGSSGSSGIGTGVSGLDFSNIGSFEFEEPDTSKVEAWVAKFKELFKPLTESWEKVKIALQPILETVGNALRWFYDNVLLPLGTWTISGLIPAFFDLLAGVLEVLDPILKAFQPSFQWLWDNVLNPIATWTGGGIVQVLEDLGGALTVIGNWMSENQSVVDGITTSIVAFFLAWKVTELLSFIQMSGGIVGALATIKNAIFSCALAKLADRAETITLTAMYAKDLVISLANGTVALAKQATQWTINTALKIANTAAQVAMTAATVAWNVICGLATIATTAFGAAVAFLTSPIGLAIIAIIAIIATGVLLYKNWDTLKAKAYEAWGAIQDKFNQFKNWLGNVFAVDWSKRFGSFGDVLNGFLKNVSNIFDSVKQVFNGIIHFVGGVFMGDWKRVWQGLVDIFGGIMNGLGAVIKAPLNTVIRLINGAISGLNKISIDIPDWVPGVGGKKFGVNIPKIPMLARGGMIGSPTLAMIGEAGYNEAVVPLDRDAKALTMIADLLAEKMPQGNIAGGNDHLGGGDIILMIDGSVIGKVALRQLRKMQRQGNVTLIPT